MNSDALIYSLVKELRQLVKKIVATDDPDVIEVMATEFEEESGILSEAAEDLL